MLWKTTRYLVGVGELNMTIKKQAGRKKMREQNKGWNKKCGVYEKVRKQKWANFQKYGL